MSIIKNLHILTVTLVWIGALNWGLVGLFNYNLVESLFGSAGLSNLVYILVGAAALYEIIVHKGACMSCVEMMSGKKSKKK